MRRRHSLIGSQLDGKKRPKMMRHGVACLIIDPQRDFHGGGSLAVPGADEVSPPSLTHTVLPARAQVLPSHTGVLLTRLLS